jgi:hypothetical protein
LGGQDPSLNLASGIPWFSYDEDKVTRRYRQCVTTEAGFEPSFVLAVADAFRDGNTTRIGDLCDDCTIDRQQEFLMRFSTDRVEVPAERVLLRFDTKANGG